MKKLNETFNVIVGWLVLIFMFGILFLSVVPIAFSHGDIYTVSIDPENPLVLEDFKINIGVRNTGTESSDYALDVFVIKDGQIKYDTYFEFSFTCHVCLKSSFVSRLPSVSQPPQSLP